MGEMQKLELILDFSYFDRGGKLAGKVKSSHTI